MKVVPQAFYQNPAVQKIMADGLSAVILKQVNTPDLNNERYASTHALTVVLQGQLKIEPYEQPSKIVSPGQMVFLPKGLYLISDIIPEHQSFEALVFFFSEELINDFVEKFSGKLVKDDDPGPWIMVLSEQVKKFADNLLDIYTATAPNKEITNIKLWELLYLLSRQKEGRLFLGRLAGLKNKTRRKHQGIYGRQLRQTAGH